MSKDNTSVKKQALIKYAETLKQRIGGPVSGKHANRVEEHRKFLERDLKKTLAKIDKL